MSRRVEVRAFPPGDEAFVRLVEDTLQRMASSDPNALAAQVRAHYPSARIVPQSPLGALGVSIVWYAYRDGVAVPDERSDGASRQTLESEAY